MKGLLALFLSLPLLLPAQNFFMDSPPVPNIGPAASVLADETVNNFASGCMMFGNVFSTTDLLCFGGTNGSAILSVSNATFPVEFYLDTLSTPFPNGDLLNILSGGNHTVVIVDALGCRDTLDFFINSPPEIIITASGTNILCNSDDTGTLTASAMGGTGNLGFAWRNCLGGPTLGGANQIDMFAGCYAVTVTDENGCTSTNSVALTEPPPYDFVLVQDSVSCFGLSDGSATITAMGGTPPYQFLWDNGSNSSIANNLDADFHFVTVTDANLCAATTLIEVLEPPLLILPALSVQNATCFGGNNGLLTASPTGGVAPYQFQWNDPASQTTAQASALTVGTYTVTVTDWNGCTEQASASITSPPELLVSFVNIAGETCAGDCLGQASINASGGVGGFQFSWSDSNIPAGAQIALNLCPGGYSVTVQDANGCTVTEQLMIDSIPPIVAQFNPMPPGCIGMQNGAIDAQITGGATPYQFLWSNGSASEDIQNLLCGQYSLELTDSLGCMMSYDIVLDCPQALIIDSIVSQNLQCFGDVDGSLTVFAHGGIAPLNFVWDDPAMQMGKVAQNLSAGNYTVIVSDANACSATASASITQPAQLSVTIAHTNVTCLNGSDGAATANVAGGIMPYTYNWGAAGTDMSISNVSVGTFTVTVTDANQCTATASVAIGQPATGVMVTATQTRFACWGENDGEASVSASGGNGGPFDFLWSNGQQGGGASKLTAGLYTVTAIDAKGCTGTQVLVIQQLDSVQVLTAYTPPSCAGYSDGVVGVVQIEGGLGMGDSTQYNYQWSLPGAANATLVSGFSAGSYFLTVTDLQGCSTVHDFDIVEPPAIEIQLAVEDASCFGYADGAVAVTGVQNAVGSVTFLWDNGETAQQLDSLPAGMYIVEVTDSEGCTAQESAEIAEPEPLSIDFDITDLICAEDSNAVVFATVSGGNGGYAYAWSNGQSTSEIQGLTSGIYVLEVTDAKGCILIDSAIVQQPNALMLSTESIEPECFGSQNGRIRLLVSGGAMPYQYSLNGGGFGGSSVFIGLGAGNYILRAKDANGCIASISTVLGQPLQIQVSLGIDSSITLGDSLLLSPIVNNSVGLVSYEWSSVLLDSFACADLPDCEEIWVNPGFSNTYRLKVTDENGCMGQAEIRIHVEKPRGVYVPTGFTPNGDFENDLLVVHGKSRQVSKVLIFRVFDRWGELLYEDQNFGVNDSSRGWDGTFRGQACDPGVYAWLLEAEYLDGYRELLKGNVTLIR